MRALFGAALRVPAMQKYMRALLSPSALPVDFATRRLSTAASAAPSSSANYTSGDLQGKLAKQIRVRGAMTIKEFMTVALTHPVHGYYMRREEVFGRGGDFVTSPEVSQVFGELIGVWCVACWERLGQPRKLRLMEAGPGRGTLIADVLRSTAVFPGFHAALSVDLVEVSDHLREVQRQTIAATGAASAVDVRWHTSLESIPADPDVPELTIAHEFLDALPVHQLVRTPQGWRERMVELREHTASAAAAAVDPHAERTDELRDLEADSRVFDFVLSANPTPASILFGARRGGDVVAEAKAAAEAKATAEATKAQTQGVEQQERDQTGGVVPVLDSAEICPGALSFVQQLCKRMAVTRGAALMIDYGNDETPKDSLRGILRHAPVHPLHQPGLVDLSVDVDFGTLRQVARETAGSSLRCPPLSTQRDFLAAMGLEARINALLKGMDDREARKELVRSAGRLVASPGMGTAYKVFAITHASVGTDGVAGFPDAPLLDGGR